MCFAQGDGQKNLGRGLVRQRMDDRGGEENYKAAANRPRKIQQAPAEQRALNRLPRHATPRSNASFETKHRPPAAFLGSPSCYEAWPNRADFARIKSRRRLRMAAVPVAHSRNARDTPAARDPLPGPG